jgi:hypothetical protein
MIPGIPRPQLGVAGVNGGYSGACAAKRFTIVMD